MFAKVNQQRCSEESRQWLENVDRTHLVLASGKLVLQKNLQQALNNLNIFFVPLETLLFYKRADIRTTPASD